MNLNILPAAVTTAKTTVSAASGSAASSSATASDGTSAGGTSTTGVTTDFATQLQAQLGEKLDPKLASQLSQLGQKISAKGQTVDKATLTQAVTTGEEDGS